MGTIWSRRPDRLMAMSTFSGTLVVPMMKSGQRGVGAVVVVEEVAALVVVVVVAPGPVSREAEGDEARDGENDVMPLISEDEASSPAW